MSLIAERFQLAKQYHNAVGANIEDIRTTRNQLLSNSDWTQLSDNGLSDTKRAEWAEYRQQLRNFTNTVNLNNIMWPKKPL